MPPYQGGGDMISSVSFEKTYWNELPYKFEAGLHSKSVVLVFPVLRLFKIGFAETEFAQRFGAKDAQD